MQAPSSLAPGLDSKAAAAELEKHQEAELARKYGGLPSRQQLLQKKKNHSRKCFDSADWALSKGGHTVELPAEQPMESLPPRIQPPSTPVMPRRLSNLGES